MKNPYDVDIIYSLLTRKIYRIGVLSGYCHATFLANSARSIVEGTINNSGAIILVGASTY